MKICINGQIVEDHAATVSIYDHGFLYGIGLFETFRTYGGQPFLLDRHGMRLEQGCRSLGIDYTFSERTIYETVRQLLEINELEDAYCRLSVSAGIAPLGLAYDDYDKPNWILYMKELSNRSPQVEAGKMLRRLHIHRNTPETDVRLKSFQFMNNVLATKEIRRYHNRDEQVEGLFFTSDGYMAEGIVSNVFFVQRHRLFTPSLETGILPGVTRSFVMELAKQCGIQVEEGLFRWERLLEADEVFLTNSIQEIVPVTMLIDEQGQRFEINAGGAGKLTKMVMEKYNDATNRMKMT